MVVIKDMETLPSCCYECPYFDDYCALTGKWERDTEQIRDNDCPLVEIVTCKGCKNYVKGALDEEICLKGHELIHENFYCADAERRE
jgi:hypothetical protein